MARILVVDDDAQILGLVKRLLRLNGHDAELAADGAQALELLQDRPYDLMIIDNIMPNMSGVDAVGIVRASARLKDLKILMFTGATVTRDVEAAFTAGIDGCIPKPFAPSRLMAKIEQTLRGALERRTV